MNLAIVIGVSKYNDPDNNLLACENDTKLIVATLNKIKKFEEILIIDQNEKGIVVKEKISEFIIKYKDNNAKVEELLFYYTGHGNYDNDEYYYLLSDYSETKVKQTSLENKELDNWIKSLNPQLTIKIVDACFSGVHYIKQENHLKKLLEKTSSGINNCYFMYSSQNTQPSLQDDKLSFFTDSFLRSIINLTAISIRYKDIIDYISDDFESNKEQTPYFVIQANNTEKFGEITKELQDYLTSEIQKLGTNEMKIKKEGSNIVDLVSIDAQRYCSESEMMENIKLIEKYISEYTFKSTDLKGLYELTANFFEEHTQEMGDLCGLGKWIQEKGMDFFAKPTFKTEKYKESVRVPKVDLSRLSSFSRISSINQSYEQKEITKFREIINGFQLTQHAPYNSIQIEAKPKFPNLSWHCMYILLIFSKTNIIFFNASTSYKYLNWNDKELIKYRKWKIVNVPAKPKGIIEKNLANIINNFEEVILDEIKEKFKTQNNTIDDNSEKKAK